MDIWWSKLVFLSRARHSERPRKKRKANVQLGSLRKPHPASCSIAPHSLWIAPYYTNWSSFKVFSWHGIHMCSFTCVCCYIALTFQTGIQHFQNDPIELVCTNNRYITSATIIYDSFTFCNGLDIENWLNSPSNGGCPGPTACAFYYANWPFYFPDGGCDWDVEENATLNVEWSCSTLYVTLCECIQQLWRVSYLVFKTTHIHLFGNWRCVRALTNRFVWCCISVMLWFPSAHK